MHSQGILFDQGPGGGSALFCDPLEVIRADGPDDVAPAFARAQDAHASGYWLAGLASYELGYCLLPKLRPLLPPERDVPLLEFGVFDAPRPGGARFLRAATERADAALDALNPAWTAADYARAFEQVHAYIAAGDIYQANLTFPITARYRGSALGLYGALCMAQPVPYGCLHDLGGAVILSRSPELFFRVTNGEIETRPMKGTQPRGKTLAEDRAARDWLGRDEKNRAENLMIVDLLRNDISRVAQVGSVKVPRLFDIESYRTVHQMVSHVTARLHPGVTLADLFAALFPCGSITGAPKIRAMQILRALEADPRGAYCGAMGWVAPGGDMCFNVAIRTLTLCDDAQLRLNVGGGVVYDSTAENEYEEALWKARFTTLPPKG